MSTPIDSIKTLSEAADQGLSGDHIPLVLDLITYLQKKLEIFEPKNLKFESVPGIMDRIVLFKDENIVIRVHFFPQGASETYKHNHQQPFISTCLEGSYQHKLWMPVNDNVNTYFSTVRKTGGGLEIPTKEQGEVKNVLIHTFEKGQTLFISEEGVHSVHGNAKTTTLVVKSNKSDSKTVTKILSKSENITEPTEEIKEIDKKKKKKELWDSFKSLISNFSVSSKEIDTVLVTKVIKLEMGVENISKVTNEILEQNKDILSILRGELIQKNEQKVKDFALILQLILLTSYYPHQKTESNKEFIWMLVKSIMTKFNMYCPPPVKDNPIRTLQNLMWVWEIHDLKPFLLEFLNYFDGHTKVIPSSLLVNDIADPKLDYKKNRTKVENWVHKYYPSFDWQNYK